MTSPGMSVGDVHVDIHPDTSGFASELKAKLASAKASVKVSPDLAGFRAELKAKLGKLAAVKVPVAPDTSGFRADLRAKLATITGLKVRVDATLNTASIATLRTALRGITAPTITIDVDITAALAKIAVLQGELAGLAAPTVNLDVDNTAALARVAALQAALTGLSAPTVNAHVGGSNAARAGASDAGAYATAFRAGIVAALRNLPTPTIGVATSEAEQRVRDLHASLSRLAHERFGVTISGEQAHRELSQIRRDIAELRARGDIGIDVDADVGAAEAALARLEAQLAGLGRNRTARVDVDTGSSISRMQLLVSAILAIGPAAIPAAAAASAALASIGNAAVAGVAGIGVAVLALSGIGGAVKALGQAREDQVRQQATLARQDKTLASGADQVRSAVASLANTRANAARSIAGAEQTLARAQRDALAVEQDLTRARQEAKESLEDLDSQIANNGNAIRRANLDLADARAALDAVANLPVDNRRRVEAQLAYDEARQQVDDLTLRQGRLAREKATADKVGVEGSRQVVAAQERIRDSQERVADAESALAEARRQAAYSIAQAQQAVVSAQRSAATSAVTSAATSGAALDELRSKLLALSPEGQRFAEFLVRSKDRGLELRRAAEAGFLPGLQRGIEAILADAPGLEGFINRTATGLGAITERQARAFTSTQWRPFFSYVDDTAVPTLDALFRSANNVGVGLGNTIAAFDPFTRSFNGGMVSMTDRFAVWSARLEENRGFKAFVSYAESRGPVVLNTLGDVLGTVLHILQAAAPYGEVVLGVLRGVSAAIDAIPVPVLTAVVAGIAGFRVAGVVAIGVVALTRATVGLAVGAPAAQAATAGLASTIAGPLTLAIIAATLAFTFMAQKSAATRAKLDELKGAMEAYGEALKDGVTAQSAEAAAAIARQSGSLRNLLELTQRAGISQQTVVAGLNGDVAARDQVIAAIRRQITAEQEALKSVTGWGDHASAAKKAEAEAHRRNIAELEKQLTAYLGTSRAAEEANRQAAALTASTRQQSQASADLQPKIEALTRLYKALSDGTATAAQRSDAYRQAIEAYTGAAISATEAEERRSAAQDAATEALRRSNGELDISKGKNAEQRATIRAARDALQEQLLATRDAMLADIARGVSLEEARKKHEARIQAILAEIPANQRNSATVQQLIKDYGAIPPEVATSLKLTGAAAVLEQLRNLKIAQLALDRNMSIPDATAIINGNQGRVFAASGGYISGPGGPRDDLIPAMLSNGEYVQQAAAVNYYTPRVMALLNARKIPREMLAMYATGGLVDWPYNVDVTDTDVPTMAQIRAKLFGSSPGFGSWPSSPSAQRGDSGVWRSIVALIRSTGPLSGSFGNGYRPGDPLWHGSGRAVDWMGYQQDALAGFLAARRPLELIHRTAKRDYAFTRGRDRGSFNNALMEAHRNHIHIAMCDGGLVDQHDHRTWAGFNPIPTATYDTGGILPPGVTLAYNGTGRDEYIRTDAQMRDLTTDRGGEVHYHLAGIGSEALSQLEALQDRRDIMDRSGRPW